MKKIKQLKSKLWKCLCQKQTSKLQLEYGGATKDYFSSITLFLLFIFNLVDQVIKSQDLISRSYLTLPFLLLSILIYNDKTSKITKSIIFLLIGIAYQMAVPDQTYLGSTVFFALSYCQYVNKNHGILLILISLITVIIKSTLSNATPSQTVLAITAFYFIYSNINSLIKNYQNKIKQLELELEKAKKEKPKPVIRNIDILDIKEEDKAIIKMYCNGMSYENINKFLGINNANDTIRRKITSIKKDNNKNNDAEFGKWLFESV